jgi:hypothetical protein
MRSDSRVPGAPFVIALFLLLGVSNEAAAGAFPFWGVSFGTPERAALHLGATFGGDVPRGSDEGVSIGTGTVIEATAGLGAGKLGIGKSLIILTEEKHIRVLADVQLVGARTWHKPRGASVHANYLGVEGGLSVSFVRFALGVSKRLEDKSRGANVLFNWNAGLQIRFGKSPKRP